MIGKLDDQINFQILEKINSNNNIKIADNLTKINSNDFLTVNRNKVYWMLQIVGWLLPSIMDIFIIAINKKLEFGAVIIYLIFSTAAIILTHIFKIYIKKHGWINFSFKKLVPQAALAIIMISILVNVFAFGANYFLHGFELHKPIINFIASTVGAILLTTMWFLIYLSFHYFENYKKAQIESLIWEAAVKDFELKTLKSQLNPHFMFNAMNSIRALIEENPTRAKDAITKLSNILRYSLKVERTEVVALNDELQIINDYLDLEKIRFEERLQYSFEISPETINIEIPPMMVQTLVENGIKHGVSKVIEGGIIQIKSFLHNGFLIISIKNNGILEYELAKYSEGIGLANTKQRLLLLYGVKASLTLSNSEDGFVNAEIKIPLGENK